MRCSSPQTLSTLPPAARAQEAFPRTKAVHRRCHNARRGRTGGGGGSVGQWPNLIEGTALPYRRGIDAVWPPGGRDKPFGSFGELRNGEAVTNGPHFAPPPPPSPGATQCPQGGGWPPRSSCSSGTSCHPHCGSRFHGAMQAPPHVGPSATPVQYRVDLFLIGQPVRSTHPSTPDPLDAVFRPPCHGHWQRCRTASMPMLTWGQAALPGWHYCSRPPRRPKGGGV